MYWILTRIISGLDDTVLFTYGLTITFLIKSKKNTLITWVTIQLLFAGMVVAEGGFSSIKTYFGTAAWNTKLSLIHI